MAKKNTGIVKFFNTASKRAEENTTREKQALAQHRKKARAKAKEEAAAENNAAPSFRDYNFMIKPVVDALFDLPADTEGNEFLGFATRRVRPDLFGRGRERELSITLIYSSQKDERDATTHYFTLPAKNGEPGQEIYPALTKGPVLEIFFRENMKTGRVELTVKNKVENKHWADQQWLANNETYRPGGFTLRSSTLRKELTLMSDIPAAIGEWVANVAPQRLPELKEALVGPAKKKPAGRTVIYTPANR
jgi:hypothetical protein